MLARRLIDGLHTEAMVLADEARAYFDRTHGGEANLPADPLARVVFTCESLKITTRLMHVIAWLLHQRGIDEGEVPDRVSEAARLGSAVESDAATLAQLPDEARALAEGSIELFRRIARLDEGLAQETAESSPAHALLERLKNAL